MCAQPQRDSCSEKSPEVIYTQPPTDFVCCNTTEIPLDPSSRDLIKPAVRSHMFLFDKAMLFRL